MKLRESPQGALQYRVFVAVHIDFDQIQAVNAFALDEIIQRIAVCSNSGNQPTAMLCVHVIDLLEGPTRVNLRPDRCAGFGNQPDLKGSGPFLKIGVQCEILLQLCKYRICGFERKHATSGSHATSQSQGMCAYVCTNIKGDIASSDELLKPHPLRSSE